MGADWSMKGGQATVLEAYVLLMDESYCSMFPELLDPWTLQNQQLIVVNHRTPGISVPTKETAHWGLTNLS